eukprot:COSAG05_NODE_21323_length_272_cov_15.346821_1_plen_44_part_01
MPPNHHQGRPQEINAKERKRDLRNQYHARKRRDTNRGEHVLEQE